MKRIRTAAAAALILGFTTSAPATEPSLNGLRFGPDSRFLVDVAMDGRTWRLDDGSNPFYPTLTGNFGRGDSFIVSGKIYIANTLQSGGDFNRPNNPAGPELPKAIGTWVCRGAFNFDFADIANGAAPHVTSTQFFYFDDGTVLMSDGAEGGTTTLRVVAGGTGRLRGAEGEVVETPLGVNDTNLFNVRFRFRIN